MPKFVETVQNRDFELRFQGNCSTYIQTFDIWFKNSIRCCYQKRSHEKILKQRYPLKTSYITPCQEEASWQLPRTARAMKISLKVSHEHYNTMVKKSQNLPICHKRSCKRECFHPTYAITLPSLIVNYRIFRFFYPLQIISPLNLQKLWNVPTHLITLRSEINAMR